MSRWYRKPGRLLLLVGLLMLSACATTNSGFNTGSYPSEADIATKLSQASLPQELRGQIIKLYNRDPAQRAEAASHLGKMASMAAPAVPYLIQIMQDDTPVQLSRYLGGGYTSSSGTTPGEEAARALADIGGPATDALLLALQDTHPNVRRLAAKALGQIGDINAVEFLIKSLNDPDRSVRATAAIALGKYRHPMAAQKIMDNYPRANEAVRADLIFTLANINDVLAVPFLVERAKDPDPDIRAAVMLALGKLRDARAIPALLDGVNDSDEITRANAVYALGAYFSPTVVDALIRALADPAPRVHEAAVESLKSLTGMDFGVNQARWQAWWSEQRRQMQSVN